jgi:hypothetical protein
MNMELGYVREQAAAALAPFFLDVAHGDRQKAMGAARATIDGYNPAAPLEFRLAAQITACRFAAMACLRTVAAAKGLPMGDVVTLQKAALAMEKAAQEGVDRLRTHQAERPPAVVQTQRELEAFGSAMKLALENMRYADSRMPPLLARAAAGPMRGKLKQTPVSGEPMTQALLSRLTGPVRLRHRPFGLQDD